MKMRVCNLECIAKVSLGFKSLQNHFFYVSAKDIKKYGLTKKFLKPIYKLADLDLDKYLQTAKAVQWVFYCKDKEQDLHGTGALRYIRAMEKVPAVKKKQTGKPQTMKEALQAQTSKGGLWYAPKAQLHGVNIWLRKAFNTVYSPIIFEKEAALDQRCNYAVPLDGIEWKELAAVFTSSLFALSAESFGAASMGAGALELATEQIQGLRVADLRDLKDDSKAREDLVTLADDVWKKTKPVDWRETEKPPQEVQDLDKWLLSRMGSSVSLERLYFDLVRTMRERLTVAEDKDIQVKKHHQLDVEAVARSIADSVRPLLESKGFPDAFIGTGVKTETFDFNRATKLEIECLPMMDQATVVVRNGSDVLVQGQYPRSVAQVIVKALLLGRRSFAYPVESTGAEATLNEFERWFPKIIDRITTGCAMSAVGTSYEEHVHDAVFKALHLDVNITKPELFGRISLHN